MINRLFSNTRLLLNEIKFRPGINVILGKYSGDEEAKGINGIGKSTVIRLIDYCFVSDSAQKIFSGKRYDFLRKEEHDILLEFDVDHKTFYIRRTFNTKDIIFFGPSLDKLAEFEKSEFKIVLADLFFPVENNDVFITGNKFRTIFDFFIKDDLENQKRFDPLNFLKFSANVKDKAIFNFFLLNLPTQRLIDYKDQATEYSDINSAVKTHENKIKTETGKSIQEYKSERFNINQRINLLEDSLEEYHFIEKYKNSERELLKLTEQINLKLKEYNSLSIKLERIRDSYSSDQNVQTKEIKKIYNEVLDNFGNQIAKTLEEVIEFKNNILANRRKYLIEKERELQKEIDKILNSISSLELSRSKIYKVLDEQGALDSLKNTYEELVIEKTELEKNLHVVKQIEDYKETLASLNVTISETKKLISDEINSFETQINELRELFTNILNNAIFVDEHYENAYFDITLNPTSGRSSLPFKIEIEIPKVDALGQARLKVIVYDLMIFLYNITEKRKFPDFLIHDGAFHGISMKTRVSTINYVYHKYLENINNKQFQYILTFNEDEINIPNNTSDYGTFDFDFDEAIIVEFQDIPEKTIFKRIFL